MKLRMADKSLFAVLLRSPWWVSFLVALALAAVLAAVLPSAYRAVGVLSALPFAVIAAIAAWRQAKLPSGARVLATQQAVSAMAWPEFAQLLEQAFVQGGYSVQRGAREGVDFEIERQGRKMLVCARRWKAASTGVEPLRTLQTAREESGVADALYIALGELTSTARPFAAQHRIAIWHAGELAMAMRGVALTLPKAKAAR